MRGTELTGLPLTAVQPHQRRDLALLWLALGYGFLIWLIPFAAAMALFQVRTTQRPLFESIMPVVLVICGVVFARRYIRRVTARHLQHGLAVGLLWLAMSVALDLPLMLAAPIAMTLPDYLMDVAVTYLVYPIITVGLGTVAGERRPN
jgi:hypothetical protein